MSWPSTDFECEIQQELTNLRKLALAVKELIAANDPSSDPRPRPDICWRDVKRTYQEWVDGDQADI